MLATNVLKSGKNKKEVKNDLLSNMAPPIIQSCNTISSFDDPLALDESISPSSKTLKSNEFKLPLILKEVAR